jgi:hypothetical protein
LAVVEEVDKAEAEIFILQLLFAKMGHCWEWGRQKDLLDFWSKKISSASVKKWQYDLPSFDCDGSRCQMCVGMCNELRARQRVFDAFYQAA